MLRQSERTTEVVRRLPYRGWCGGGHRSGVGPSMKRFDRRDDPLRLGLRLPNTISLSFAIALACSGPSYAAAQPQDVPAWLQAHAGEGEGQIARVVLERARALYLQKAVRNPCYFAMHATRPNGGAAGRRFYIICEADRSFRAISAGHGGGGDLNGVADFANGRRCAKNFGNAMASELAAGGGLCDERNENLFQRLLPCLSERRRGFPALVRSV
jgi:hypothetical protein